MIKTSLKNPIPMLAIASLLLVGLSEHGLAKAKDSAKADVRLVVRGLSEIRGQVRVAIVNSRADFKDDDAKAITDSVIVESEAEELVFRDVPFGTYAVKIFHDANGNGKLDTNLFGIPTEKYGFSNNARSKLGLPDFDDAKVEILERVVSLEVKLDHY